MEGTVGQQYSYHQLEMCFSYYTNIPEIWFVLLGFLLNQGLIKSEQTFTLLHQHTYSQAKGMKETTYLVHIHISIT